MCVHACVCVCVCVCACVRACVRACMRVGGNGVGVDVYYFLLVCFCTGIWHEYNQLDNLACFCIACFA